MMQIVLVAAVGKHNVIGVNGTLPWHLSDDLKHFKTLTSGGCVIMGRTTYESIGKALPHRFNIVVTSRQLEAHENLVAASSCAQALETAKNKGFSRAFVIGGEALYRATLPLADELQITHVDLDVAGDRYFPDIDFSVFCEDLSEPHVDAKTGTPMRFVTYKRIAQS